MKSYWYCGMDSQVCIYTVEINNLWREAGGDGQVDRHIISQASRQERTEGGRNGRWERKGGRQAGRHSGREGGRQAQREEGRENEEWMEERLVCQDNSRL